jgi:hypothetical protein
MCYSAQISAEYKKFVRMFGAVLSIRAFSKLYYERQSNPRIKIPKAVDALFLEPQTPEEKEIKDLIGARDPMPPVEAVVPTPEPSFPSANCAV